MQRLLTAVIGLLALFVMVNASAQIGFQTVHCGW